MKKLKKSELVNALIFFLCVIAMLITSFAFGQVERIKDGIITKRFTSNSLCFKSPLISRDTIFLNLMSDSLDSKTITFNAYVYYPSKINVGDESIIIGYDNGTQSILQKYNFDKKTNCASYELVGDINSLINNKVSFVLFRGIAKYDKFDKNYFADFFKYL